MKNITELYKIYLQHRTITTDSRKIEKDCLFFALKGESFDGNKYAKSAIEKGAAYAIIDDNSIEKNDKIILVDDVLKTLQDLANFHRKQLKIPVIGITGTNGKTTTKELIYSVLKKKYKTHATAGNFNNHIGVPLTLLSIPESCEIAIIEMGANHCFEIEELCNIAEPNYGLITNIGKAHIEGFGSFENVIKTKSELYQFIENNNETLFYNSDNELLSGLIKTNKKISYGTNSSAKTKGKFIISSPFLKFEIETNNKEKIEINTNLTGKYNLENALSAVAIGNYFDVDLQSIKIALEEYKPKNNRSQLLKTKKNNLWLDAYNANPSSMKASLENFFEHKTQNKTLILGDMLELGIVSKEEHLNILKLIEKNNFEGNIFLIGKEFCNIKEINSKFIFFENTDFLQNHLKENPIENNDILIKGSRGIRLENIIELL